MDKENMLNTSVDAIKNLPNQVLSKYETFIRQKAIKKVDEKLTLHKLTPDDISKEDYEAMVSEAIKDIKEDYATKAAQGALALLGLDLLTGW
jgi:hypothetical protein